VIISPQNPQVLAETLKKLVDAPCQVKQYMENSQKVFFEIFDRKKIYDNYIKYLTQHIDNHIKAEE